MAMARQRTPSRPVSQPVRRVRECRESKPAAMPSTDPCSICATISLDSDTNNPFKRDHVAPRPPESEESKALITKLFHEQCARCRVTPEFHEANLDPDLCPFCRHLRLWHILRCDSNITRYCIAVCQFKDLPERASACSFCRLLTRYGLPYVYFFGPTPASAYQDDWLGINFGIGRIQTIRYSELGGWTLLSKIQTIARPLFPPGVGSSTGAQPWFPSGVRSSTGARPWFPPGVGSSTGAQPLFPPGVRSSTGAVDSEDGADARAIDLTNRVSPVVRWAAGGLLNWPRVEQSFEACLQHHDECARPGVGASISLPANFRVIDVKKRRLVQMPPSCRFVALSYVWGRQPDPTKLFTTNFNLSFLEEDGGLRAQDMPATVEDAMNVCRRLKEPYLWVDRFCIVQDDYGHKAQQVAAMAAIYSLAKLVIIVTDGNSDSGIAGVSRERLQKENRTRIAGIDIFSNLASLKEVEDGCIWSTRGWTYQEAVLARRKLFFTESLAFFECRKSGRGEDGSAVYIHERPRTFVPPTQPGSGALVQAFYKHLDHYRRRSLTNASDIYDAIGGVADALYGEPGSLWWGLPRRDIDQALLWCIEWNWRARGSELWITVPNPATYGTGPSWSWSVTGKRTRLLLNNSKILDLFGYNYCETLVAWACIRKGADGPGRRTVESVETVSGGNPLSHFDKGRDRCGCPNEMSHAQVEGLLYAVVAWSYGCITAPYPFVKLENTTFKELRSQIKSRWACRHDYWLEAFGGTEHLKSPLGDIHVAVPGTIFTWAQSAFFPLQAFSTSNAENGYLRIADGTGEPFGLLVFQDNTLDLKPDTGRRPKFEFIALSMISVGGTVEPGEGYCRRKHTTGLWWVEQTARDLTVRDREGEHLFDIPAVSVMLIERTGENRARRAGVGWIYLSSWVNAGPEFGMIYLE